MRNYLVVYTIKNDDEKQTKRTPFVDALEELGLRKFDDQSTNYGRYNGTKDELVSKLQKLKQDLLTETDTVTLFYATTESLNLETIENID